MDIKMMRNYDKNANAVWKDVEVGEVINFLEKLPKTSKIYIEGCCGQCINEVSNIILEDDEVTFFKKD